ERTIIWPSGDHRGIASNALPLVTRVACPPAIGSVYRSPRRSNTIVRPSELTSSEIHVPSVVVNEIARPVCCAAALALRTSDEHTPATTSRRQKVTGHWSLLIGYSLPKMD